MDTTSLSPLGHGIPELRYDAGIWTDDISNIMVDNTLPPTSHWERLWEWARHGLAVLAPRMN